MFRSPSLCFALCFCAVAGAMLSGCHREAEAQGMVAPLPSPQEEASVPPAPKSIGQISPPKGFGRSPATPRSFANYLRNFPLSKDNTVYLYNGTPKNSQSANYAVLDMDVGEKDLQQCADAAMRLWAEHLYESERYEDISFKLMNGMSVGYEKWRTGYRVAVRGNKTEWIKRKSEDSSYATFRSYLEFIYTYAGTASLSRDLPAKPNADIAIGDVIIQGGSPGHAIIVVDMAEHTETGEQVMLLAQSYMPAQSMHVLRNPVWTGGNPWYKVSDLRERFDTPSWVFREYKVVSFE